MRGVRKIVIGVVVFAGTVSCTTRTAGPAGPAEPADPPSTTSSTIRTESTVDKPGDVAVGDCVEFTDRSPADTELATIDCAERAAVYEVAATLPSPTGECPTDAYDLYQQTGQDEFTLCLMLNARQGECFDGLLVGAGPSGPVRANCRGAEAIVTKVLPGRADAEACPPGTALPLAYPQPPPGRRSASPHPRREHGGRTGCVAYCRVRTTWVTGPSSA